MSSIIARRNGGINRQVRVVSAAVALLLASATCGCPPQQCESDSAEGGRSFDPVATLRGDDGCPPLSAESATAARHVTAQADPAALEAEPISPAATSPRRQSVAYEQTRALLPSHFREHETPRFVVLSDAPVQTMRAQAQRLERTYHQFQRFVRRLGVDAQPLRHKLVCVLFEDRGEYRSFASVHDGVVDPWIAGYYAPAHDRVVFYHGSANPSVVEARGVLDHMEMEVQAISRELELAHRSGLDDQAQALRRYHQRYESHLRAERERVETFARQVDVATTLHEAFHQLMFHTGVQSHRIRYPLWVSEGLATAFETDDPDTPFGPDREYEPRRAAFEELLTRNWLFDLQDLVRWTEVPFNDDLGVYTLYHQSYALVNWMWRTRRSELRDYLELMKDQHADPLTPERHQQLFETVFGGVTSLESAWLHQERVQVSEQLARQQSPPPSEVLVSSGSSE